uniref:Uncharacterized protein n=1 Tax=Tetraselmis chuii TaxID=63592 RepID=A0A7S1SHB1_9CHLO|mmetsp:Transcript_11755/g.21234  ORF Transcript_11755/g.21234 Transcript_11755/m.21234 type:complete len:361 (+) Transcript_11755:303-1385(+)
MYGNAFAMLEGASDEDDGSSGSEQGGDINGNQDTVPVFVPATDDDDVAPHKFKTDDIGDHAETPLEAYRHIAPLLLRLAKRLKVSAEELKIYDPFFCEGRTKARLAGLGFSSVYNRNEDFYAAVAAKACPDFDVLVTNPPFSGDNIERFFRFAVRSNKPWFMLVPAYVAKKAFYQEWLHNRRGAVRPAFVGPTQLPYVFTAPDRDDVRLARAGDVAANPELTRVPSADTSGSGSGGEAGAEAVEVAARADVTRAVGFEVRAGSFQCVWFFSLGNKHQKPVLDWWHKTLNPNNALSVGLQPIDYTVAAYAHELPQLTAVQKATPAERRLKKKLSGQQGAKNNAGVDEAAHVLAALSISPAD